MWRVVVDGCSSVLTVTGMMAVDVDDPLLIRYVNRKGGTSMITLSYTDGDSHHDVIMIEREGDVGDHYASVMLSTVMMIDGYVDLICISMGYDGRDCDHFWIVSGE